VATERFEGRAVSRRIGVLGGAFNPPHVGHLVLAHEATYQLGLERVLLVPVGEAPHRTIDPEPGPEVRLELVRVAVEGDGGLEASDVEVAREGPSFMFRTLELLQEREPDDELILLMGADVAASLESWKEPGRVLELARIAVAGRPGTILDEAEAALESLGGSGEVIRMPELGISSTRIRRRVAAGRPIRYLVPEAIERMITERGLYGAGAVE
jgi:nicotinate-nucleotide adenylyltransferase